MILRINRVSQFMQHDFHPLLIILNITENTDITLPIYIFTKGMRVLPVPLIQVTLGQDIIDREPNAGKITG